MLDMLGVFICLLLFFKICILLINQKNVCFQVFTKTKSHFQSAKLIINNLNSLIQHLYFPISASRGILNLEQVHQFCPGARLECVDIVQDKNARDRLIAEHDIVVR